MKRHLINLTLVVATVAVMAVIGEVAVRFQNSDQRNYNVEMWRYSKELKRRSADPILSHEHIPNSRAELQRTDIRINNLGIRGPDADLLDDSDRTRILIIGSSITLGWGVPEDETLTGRLQKELGDNALVLNAGVGNYNAERYVRFAEKLAPVVKPDIVVLHAFVNDGEILPPGGGNLLLRNSQLAAMVYQLVRQAIVGASGVSSLENHYRAVYAEGSEGRARMTAAFDRLDALSRDVGFVVIFAMTPDIHQLKPYPFDFVHEIMRGEAKKRGWAYVDFLNPMQNAESAASLWAIPGDPHPNSKGHAIMAETLLKKLHKAP